jgi:hypothetical protein
MSIVITSFPLIKPDKDEGFRKWFAWPSKEFANHNDLIRRRLLRTLNGGNYAAIVEHESHRA